MHRLLQVLLHARVLVIVSRSRKRRPAGRTPSVTRTKIRNKNFRSRRGRKNDKHGEPMSEEQSIPQEITQPEPPNKTLSLYQSFAKYPFGKRLFSAVVARKAPYFSTIHPRIVELRPGYCEILLKKRRIVQNHIGTVHVIAICNLLEMAMGVMAEASIPASLRWIPKGMDVKYPAKGDSDIVGVAEIDQQAWFNGPDVPISVKAYNARKEVVVDGTIHLWVTERRAKK